MALLHEIFGDRIISRFSDFNWLPRSPDLTAPNFFLWDYFKGKVYANKLRTIQEFKANIREKVRALRPSMIWSFKQPSLTKYLDVSTSAASSVAITMDTRFTATGGALFTSKECAPFTSKECGCLSAGGSRSDRTVTCAVPVVKKTSRHLCGRLVNTVEYLGGATTVPR